jgi:NADP+-dependent farnesol dehydrogenase
MEKWSNQVAVVSGGSSGMGAAIVESLTNYNMTVINIDRNINEENIEQLNKKAEKHGGKVFGRQTDISDIKSLKETFKWIKEKFSVINIHVNSAGVAHNASLLGEDSTEKINNTIDINFRGTVHVTREAVKLMKRSNDNCIIINISSMFGNVIPFPMVGNVYTPTKFGIRAFSEVLRQELIVSGDEKIRVTNLSPGTIKTNVRKTGGWENTEEFYKQRPYLESKEIAKSILYILSTPYNVNVTELSIKPVGEKF